MSQPNTFLGLTRAEAPWATARAVIVPAPLDTDPVTTLAHGPDAVLAASRRLETYDEDLDQETIDVGLHTASALKFDGLDPEAAVKAVANSVERWLARGKFVLVLGGEQTVTLGAALAHLRRGRRFGVLHLGAQANLQPLHQGREFGPSCVGTRLVEAGLELTGVGWRSFGRVERRSMARPEVHPWVMSDLDPAGQWVDAVVDRLPPEIYLSIDLSVLDPALMPAVPRPVPGGLAWEALVDFGRRVFNRRRVIGVDVSGLAPIAGLSAPDLVAAKLVYRLLGLAFPGVGAA
ncbi:MAG: arginase family protein [Proteobacteria bacterium]|nr:arginase family protein [Pseudomonadota bacterium]MBU1742781.1 arginase family protein [Pseudomonadota bacterium]